MEPYIQISFLNDFIFCPRSIYFHQLYSGFIHDLYKQKPQLEGSSAHRTIDDKTYSTKKSIMQGMSVFSEKYNICGKVDVFDVKEGKLIERKKNISMIYDGYIFQVYAQCHALREMGYIVNEIIIHDLDHNKNYPIPLPENDDVMQKKFDELIESINSYNMFDSGFIANFSKCSNCIYSKLCDKSLC